MSENQENTLFPFYGNYFDGKFNQPPTSGLERVEIFLEKSSPADLDSPLWKIPVDFRHIDDVLASLNKGAEALSKTTLEQRIEILRSLNRILDNSKTDLANSLAIETGRPLWDCLEEVSITTGNIEYAIKHTQEFTKEFVSNKKDLFYFKSLGAALIIGSFSDPFALPLEQMIYLFLAGNPVAYKPSFHISHTAQLLFTLIDKAEFPIGSVNLLLGNEDMSLRMLQTKEIKNIFFAGSTDHGQEITKLLGTDLHTKLNLQLSCKNCGIVDQNIDIDLLAPNLVKSAFQASGQFSTRTSLIFAHKDIIDDLIDKTHSLAKKIIIDHPTKFTNEPFMGPLISQKNVDNYLQYMGMALREGASEVMRGKKLDLNHKGYYVTPSIHYYEEVSEFGHFLKTEQLFPNITFIKYDDIQTAIDQVNTLSYGLSCSLFLQDEQQLKKCIEQLDVGIIMKNSFLDHHKRHFRFGGDKDSSNFTNIGTAMFEAGLRRVTIKENKLTENLSTLVGIKKD